MLQGDTESKQGKPEGNGLESYRRLVELQKQMIELSQQHEQARREFDALREVVAQEVMEQSRSRQSVGTRLRATAIKLLRRSPAAFARQFFS